MDFNQFNIEATTFLRKLRMFSENTTIQITENTVECLIGVIECVEQLIAVAEIIPTNSAIDTGLSLSIGNVSWTEKPLKPVSLGHILL